PTVPKSNASSWPSRAAKACPSAPTTACIERAHITASFATLAIPPSLGIIPPRHHAREDGLDKLSRLIKGPDLILAPCALNPIMAQMAAAAGFKAAYLSGGSLGWYKGVTEAGLSLTEMI